MSSTVRTRKATARPIAAIIEDVFLPTAMTSIRASPLITLLPQCKNGLLMLCTSTGLLSSPICDSSTSKECPSIYMPSAGTRSPTPKQSTSPTTTSEIEILWRFPFLMTVVFMP